MQYTGRSGGLEAPAQSSLAIMSCLAIGVKLSMSRPCAARTGLMCGGTSWWLSDGLMDSSADGEVSMYATAGKTSHIGLTMTGEVEQRRKIPQLASLVSGVGQLRVRVAKLVEKRMDDGIDGT